MKADCSVDGVKSAMGRRIFVGSVVAGVPFLAGTTALVAQRGGSPSHDHSAAVVDPVIDHLLRQMAVIHNAAQVSPRGEHFRALAAQLRTLVVYERQIDMDGQIRTVARQIVDRQGRNTILYAEPDVEARRKHLQAYGFRLRETRGQREIIASAADREAALDTLLTRGVTPTFERIAATAERVGSRMDASPVRPAAAQDLDHDWWVGFCSSLWQQYQEAQLMVMPVCALAKYAGFMLPSCGAMEAGAMMLLLVYIGQCQMFGY
jgi:hypothetical protein